MTSLAGWLLSELKKGDPLPPSVPPGPLNPLGNHALYLSKPGYLIHGTNKPASIGLRATNGCIRLYPEDIEKLFENTPVKTPVKIIYQPYLAGQHDGLVYLEAHPLFDVSGRTELKKIYAKLKKEVARCYQAPLPFRFHRLQCHIIMACLIISQLDHESFRMHDTD
jgi:L,D-transpeptidase ErfK/SrfK